MLDGLDVPLFPLIIIVTGLLLLEPLKEDDVFSFDFGVVFPSFLGSNRMKIGTLMRTLWRNGLVDDLLQLGNKDMVLSFYLSELPFFYECTLGIIPLSKILIVHLNIDL